MIGERKIYIPKDTGIVYVDDTFVIPRTNKPRVVQLTKFIFDLNGMKHQGITIKCNKEMFEDLKQDALPIHILSDNKSYNFMGVNIVHDETIVKETFKASVEQGVEVLFKTL